MLPTSVVGPVVVASEPALAATSALRRFSSQRGIVQKTSPDMRFWIALSIAVASDLVDFFGGFLPWIGDIIDGVTIFLLFPFIGPFALFGAPELLSVVFPLFALIDFLPLFSVGVIFWKIFGKSLKR